MITFGKKDFMENTTLISVIVPIYGVERYIDQCINSILNQTYRHFELILVDDGSKDKSPSICDEYAKKDMRIKVIHKENGGLVSARKAGLEISTGSYILNVDGDDFIENNMLEHMIQLAEKYDADVVVSGYYSSSENEDIELKNSISSGVYREDNLSQLKKSLIYTGEFYNQSIIPALWNKLFRREVYYKFQMAVPNEITMGEDFVVSYPALLNSNCIVVDNEFYPYHYRFVTNSMSRKFSLNYFDHIRYLFNYVDTLFDDSNRINILMYKLFLLKIGCDGYLFSTKNLFYLLTRLINIRKILSIPTFTQIIMCIEGNEFPSSIKDFIKALTSKRFTKYIFLHYLKIIQRKIGGKDENE